MSALRMNISRDLMSTASALAFPLSPFASSSELIFDATVADVAIPPPHATIMVLISHSSFLLRFFRQIPVLDSIG